MINKILENLSNVTITQKEGQLFADKSYKYDTVFFLSKFILRNLNAENIYEVNTLENNAISYVKDIFNLQDSNDNQKIKNYLSETLTILQFGHVINKISKNQFKIVNMEILEFVTSCLEHAYIFLYLVAYATLKNDNKLGLYERYVKSNIHDKKVIIQEFEDYIKLAPRIKKWAPFKTKFLLTVLGYANEENEIARTLNIQTKRKITTETISINIEGTRTPSYLPKKNDYIEKFNKYYIQNKLKNYLFIDIIQQTNEKPISTIANELADLKIDILKANDVVRQKSNFDQDQFIETHIKARNQNIQRIFREGLFKNNSHICPICGFEYKDFLIASHIKPYSKCDDTYDAINFYNGFLMCPNHDKLFEGAKLMTIDASTGEIILSKEAAESKDFSALNGKFVDKSLIECERRHYLKWHNNQFKSLNA